MQVIPTAIPEVLLIEPDVFTDRRGYFLETYHAQRYASIGLADPFVQDNFSWSVQGALRGLHYQLPKGQGKLVMVLDGAVFDVAVDIRRGSPTFGRWVSVELSSDNKRQLYIPAGFAHGFCVLSPSAAFLYKCTEFYAPLDERGIRWDDPALGIPWPVPSPLVSPKDEAYTGLAEAAAVDLPTYRPRRRD